LFNSSGGRFGKEISGFRAFEENPAMVALPGGMEQQKLLKKPMWVL